MANFYKTYEDISNAFMFGRAEKAMPDALAWISECEENPFSQDSIGYELFAQAQRNYKIWISNGISSRVSGRRCEKNLRELFTQELPNPYDKQKEEEKELKAEEEKKEPIHVLGVLPDEETIEKEKELATTSDVKEEEIAEEKPKTEKFFGRHKKR